MVFVTLTPLLEEEMAEVGEAIVELLDIEELVDESVRVIAPATEELANVIVINGCNEDASELTPGVYPYGFKELTLCAAGNIPELELVEPVKAPTAEPLTVVKMEFDAELMVMTGTPLVDCEPA